MKKRPKYNFFALCALLGMTFILIYLTNRYILTINFYENSGDPISGIPGQEAEVYLEIQKWIYLSSAFYLLAKLVLIALVLYTALYLADHQVPYRDIFRVVVLSEFIFFIPAVIKIFWFHFYFPDGTLTDWHRFYVLSLIDLFPAAPADYYYALQTVNLFEVAYWFLLALGICQITKTTYDYSLKLVLFSYLPALLIWVAVVTFSSVMFFPDTA